MDMSRSARESKGKLQNGDNIIVTEVVLVFKG